MTLENQPSDNGKPEENQQPVPEKITWPKLFDQCPNCGSKVRLGATAIQQLKDEGKLHKDSFNGGLMMQIPLLDQAHPPSILGPMIKIPVLFVFYDVCECGTMYCTRFECVESAAQVTAQKQSPPPGFRGYPGNPGRRN